jgi:ankyrin repeat protein
MIAAAVKGHAHVVTEFLSRGASVEEKSAGGRTVLSWATEFAQLSVVKLLVEKGADLSGKAGEKGSAVCVAATVGDVKLLKFLLSKGAVLEDTEASRHTPLLLAVKHGRTEAVKFLLGRCARFDVENADGKGALELAANDEVKKLIANAFEAQRQKDVRSIGAPIFVFECRFSSRLPLRA